MAFIYKTGKNEKLKEKNLEMLDVLPDFCTQYVIYMERSISPSSLNTYLLRISKFLEYLHADNSYFGNKEIFDFKVSDMANLTPDDINAFSHWIYNTNCNHRKSSNPNTTISKSNKETTVDNYLSAINSLWNFFLTEKYVKYNPVASVKRSRQKQKEIIKLDPDEQAKFLDSLYCGEGFNEKQLMWNEKTRIRDIAMLMVLFGTGIRVSELVGMDVDDLDFQNNCFKVLRKRDKIDVVYFGDEVKEALIDYLEERVPRYQPVDNETALFLVGIGKYKGTRLSVKSVQNIVKKFAKASLPLKGQSITPHKLRSTYGTSLYRETGDIYLVADVLGHKDVNTTKKHYAAQDDRKKREAANIVKIR